MLAVALKFGSLLTLAPIGSFTLIVNVATTRIILREKSGLVEFVCSLVIVAGCVVAVITAPCASRSRFAAGARRRRFARSRHSAIPRQYNSIPCRPNDYIDSFCCVQRYYSNLYFIIFVLVLCPLQVPTLLGA